MSRWFRFSVFGLRISDLRVLSRNPPTAKDQVILVKDCGLTRRDGALGSVQFYFRAASGQRGNCRGSACVGVTNLCRCLKSFRRRIEGNPIAPVDDELVALERRIISDDDSIGS